MLVEAMANFVKIIFDKKQSGYYDLSMISYQSLTIMNSQCLTTEKAISNQTASR